MKKRLNKLFYFFTINIVLLTGILLIQSCQDDNEVIESSQEIDPFQNFENQLYEAKPFFENLISVESNRNTVIENSKESKVSISEENVLEKIQPLVNSSVEIIKSYGITTEELNEHFDDLSDERIA